MRTPPSLRRIAVPAEAGAWARAGFSVDEGVCRIGSVTVDLGAEQAGWSLEGEGTGAVDGIATTWVAGGPTGVPPAHANGVTGVDHVVVVTGSPARTTGALEAAGAEVRRVADVGGRRTAFLWLGDVICEVTEAGDRPAALWGVTLVAPDLDATAARLGGALGAVRPAVQPGRRIATVRREAGLGLAVAIMTPHVREGSNPVRAREALDAGPGDR